MVKTKQTNKRNRPRYVKCLKDTVGLKMGNPISIRHYEHGFLCESLYSIRRPAIFYKKDISEISYVAKYDGDLKLFTSIPLEEGELTLEDLRSVTPNLKLPENKLERKLMLKNERSLTSKERNLLKKGFNSLNKRYKNSRIVREVLWELRYTNLL